jgi:hypothetical protein
MTLDNKQKELITIGAILAGVIVVVLIGKKLADIVGGIGSSLGLTESEADKSAAAAVSGAEAKDYFSPSFLKKAPIGSKVVLLTSASANAKAKRIYDAIGIFTDNENEIVGAFNDLTTKSQVSFLAQAFKNLYSQDLLNFLRTKLDTQAQKEALVSILKRLDKLPNYSIK